MIYLHQKTINFEKLHKELQTGCPFYDFLNTYFENDLMYAEVHTTQELTTEEQTTLTNIVVAHDPTPTVVIQDVTPRQIRQALILSGVSMATIETALDSLPEPTKSLAKAEWEYSNMFERNRPLVASVGVMLGWTNQQLDDLWIFAKTL